MSKNHDKEIKSGNKAGAVFCVFPSIHYSHFKSNPIGNGVSEWELLGV